MDSEEDTSCDDPAWGGLGWGAKQGGPGHVRDILDDEVGWPCLPKRNGIALFEMAGRLPPQAGEADMGCPGSDGEEEKCDMAAKDNPGDAKEEIETESSVRSVVSRIVQLWWPGGRDTGDHGATLGSKGESAGKETDSDSEISSASVKRRRKKKWRQADVTAMTSFNLSLFPRPVVHPKQNEDNLEDSCATETEIECAKFEEMCRALNIENFDICTKDAVTSHRLRMTRKHKKRKAAKQVKDKYCRSVKNNNRERLYIKHVVYKKIDMEQRGFNFLPSPKQEKAKLDAQMQRGTPPPAKPTPKARFEVNDKTISSDLKRNLDKQTLSALVELQHRDLTDGDIALLLSLEGGILQETFVETMTSERRAELQELERALLAPPTPSAAVEAQNGADQTLLDLMTRDLTPEDYELLLQLDESVAPKTLETDLVKSLRTIIVTSDIMEMCPICMDTYEMGTTMKYLPCDHAFHERCVDAWLMERSMNCPLDGLPVSVRV